MTRLARYTGTWLSAIILMAGLAGIALVALCGHTLYMNHVARRWPVTDGRVVSSQTLLLDASLGKPGNAKIPKAFIEFEYNVNGTGYKSSRVAYANRIGDGPKHYVDPSYAVTYPKGTKIQVAYDPANPVESVIDVSRDPYVKFAIGVIFISLFIGYQFWLRGGRGSGPDKKRGHSPLTSAIDGRLVES